MQEMQETGVPYLDQKDLLEEEMAIRPSILAWKIPRIEEPGRLLSMGSQRVGHYLSMHAKPNYALIFLRKSYWFYCAHTLLLTYWVVPQLLNPSSCILFSQQFYCSLSSVFCLTNIAVVCVCTCILSHSVMSDSSLPHGLQHTRLSYPSEFPRKFAQTHVHWLNDAIKPSHPLSPLSPPALHLSQLRVFSSESALHIR